MITLLPALKGRRWFTELQFTWERKTNNTIVLTLLHWTDMHWPTARGINQTSETILI